VPGAQYVVDRWWALSRDELTDEVRHTVRSGGSEAQKIWDAVLTDQKLAARVRGILSSLRTQMKSHRDAAMWEVWIANARRALIPPSRDETPAPAARPTEKQTTTEPNRFTVAEEQTELVLEHPTFTRAEACPVTKPAVNPVPAVHFSAPDLTG
jgi:hypothetical protein